LKKKEIDDEDDDVIANSKMKEVKDGQVKLRSVQDQDELKKKDYSAMRILENSFNPEASTMLQNIEQGMEILLEQAHIVLFSGIVIDEVLSNLMKHGIMMIQKLEKNGKMLLKRS
jgi:hypothetical protein